MYTKSVLDDFIIFATAKYGDPKITVRAINGFLEGKITHITRDGNYRELFSKLNPREVWDIMGGAPEFYVDQTLEKYLEHQRALEAKAPNSVTPAPQPTVSRGLSIDTFNIFMDACNKTAAINYNQLLTGLKSAEMGNFAYLCNGELLSKILSPEDIKKCCMVALKNAGNHISQSVDVVVDFANYVSSTIQQSQQQHYSGQSY